MGAKDTDEYGVGDMPIIEIGIVYRYHADGDDHAEEQFIDALGFTDNPVEAQHIRDSINVVRTIQE